MSNFTAPSSRIFNRSDWQSSWFLMFTRFMMSKVFRGFSRRAIRIFSRSVIGVPCIGLGDGTCCTHRLQRLHSRDEVRSGSKGGMPGHMQACSPARAASPTLHGPCRAPQRLRRLAEGADEGAPHALGIAEPGRLRDEF